MTRVDTCVLLSEVSLASPKSATWKTKQDHQPLHCNQTPQQTVWSQNDHQQRQIYHCFEVAVEKDVCGLDVAVNDPRMAFMVTSQMKFRKGHITNQAVGRRQCRGQKLDNGWMLTVFVQVGEPFRRPQRDAQPRRPLHHRLPFPCIPPENVRRGHGIWTFGLPQRGQNVVRALNW
jgi:hypothetical protein